jgi:hypothetical protein
LPPKNRVLGDQLAASLSDFAGQMPPAAAGSFKKVNEFIREFILLLAISDYPCRMPGAKAGF